MMMISQNHPLQFNADVAQLVEQEFCKLQVVGSNPIASSKRVSYNGITLAFQANDVGSIPTTRSIPE